MKRPANPRPRQVVSEDVLTALLELVRRKFYEGEAVEFSKDTFYLQRWVIFWPARHWFDARGVTVPNHRYQDILTAVLIDAAAFQQGKIKYRPAFLRHVIQEHFKHHGEDYYAEAKSTRALADHALSTLGKVPVKERDDIVERFVAADRLLEASKRTAKAAVRGVKKPAVNDQLTLI